MLLTLVIASFVLQLAILAGLARLRLGRRTALVGAGCGLLATLAWAVLMDNNASLYQHLPLKYGFVLCNLTPTLLAVTLGCAAHLARLHAWRMAGYVLLLVALQVFYHGALVYGVPECMQAREGVAILQTTDHTCSAAAAATLLGLHGIEATEGEMAGLCLTTSRGTSIGQLYHGLRMKCDDRGLAVQVEALDRAEMERLQPPAIVSVKLTAAVDAREPRYRSTWGWLLGVPHAVVLLARNADGTVTIADPRIGVEVWPYAALVDLWDAKVVTLRRRE